MNSAATISHLFAVVVIGLGILAGAPTTAGAVTLLCSDYEPDWAVDIDLNKKTIDFGNGVIARLTVGKRVVSWEGPATPGHWVKLDRRTLQGVGIDGRRFSCRRVVRQF